MQALRPQFLIIIALFMTSACGLMSRKKPKDPRHENTFIRQESDVTPESEDATGQSKDNTNPVQALDTQALQAPNLQRGNSELQIPDKPEGNPFTCEEKTTSPTPLLRLTRKEYTQSIEDLFGEFIEKSQVSNILQSIPSDNRKGIFHNQDLSIALPTIQGYFSTATQLSDNLSQNVSFLEEYFPCEILDAECLQKFADSLGKKIIKRPWVSEDFEKYQALIESADTDGNKPESARVLLTALLQSPDMIYKVELGDSEISAGIYSLTDSELAHRLSYSITGHLPPDQMWDAIEQGTLQDPNILKEWIDRLIQKDQTQLHTESFYSQWLSFDELPSAGYTDRFLSGINPASIAEDAKNELRLMTTELTWGQKGSYSDLLSTTESYSPSSTLAAIYQSTPPGDQQEKTLDLGMFQFSDNGPEDVMGKEQWTPYGNQASATVAVTLEASDSFYIDAYGVALNNIPPTMTIKITNTENVEVQSQNIEIDSASPTAYSVQIQGLTGKHTIAFGTNNDEIGNNGQDRNLWILQARQVKNIVSTKKKNTNLSRKGLLSRVGFLLSGDDSTHLVHRGVKVRQRILCEKMNPPAVDPDNPELFNPPAPDPDKSTKDQIAEITSAPQCAACHTRINPMGFILENFDAIGRYREVERIFSPEGVLIGEHPINSVVHPNLRRKGEPEVHNINEMSDAIAKSNKGAACLTLQWFAYTRQRQATENDMCEMSELYDQLQTPKTTSYSGEDPATLRNLIHSSFLTGAFQTLVKPLEE